MLAQRLALLVPLAVLLSGCPSTPAGDAGDAGDVTTSDAGNTDTDVSTDAPPADAPDVVDTGPADAGPTPSLFGRCVDDSSCLPGDKCLTEVGDGYPGGFCTHPCDTDDNCVPQLPGQMGVCLALAGQPGKVCQRYCTNGADCGRSGYTCIELNHTFMIDACVPSCTDADCTMGDRCNAWTGKCEATSVPYPPPGAENGEACMQDTDCKGDHCIQPVSSSRRTPTGYNNGYCDSPCALPTGWNPSTFYAGNAFPQSNCPTGSVCIPAGSNWAVHDPGVCLAACMSDSDCRVDEGYMCRRSFQLANSRTKTFDNGFCEPVDCLNDATHPCPTGYTCQTVTASDGSQSGNCKPAPVTDAGTPDVVDSSTPDTGASDSGSTDDGGIIDDVSLPDASLPDVFGE